MTSGEKSFTKTGRMRRATFSQVCQWIITAWSSVKESTITNGSLRLDCCVTLGPTYDFFTSFQTTYYDFFTSFQTTYKNLWLFYQFSNDIQTYDFFYQFSNDIQTYDFFLPVFRRHTNLWLFYQFSDDILTYDFFTSFQTTYKPMTFFTSFQTTY